MKGFFFAVVLLALACSSKSEQDEKTPHKAEKPAPAVHDAGARQAPSPAPSNDAAGMGGSAENPSGPDIEVPSIKLE